MSESTVRESTQTAAASSAAGARIELLQLTKKYAGQTQPAVEDISMDIAPGEIVMFVGPSGCGKTTTMKMINRIIEPTSGQIRIGGRNILELDPSELRRGIGYVIQQIGLFPHMSIAQNIGLVPQLLGWDKTKIATRVDELLDVVGLEPTTYRSRYPKQLSGGQQQRVGVARALAADPPVMLMDEPFGATDPITRERLQAEFKRLQKSLGKTIVFVTHDFNEAVVLGDRIAVLAERSRIVQFDTPANILAAPANDYVRSFVGSAAAIRSTGMLLVSEALAQVRTAPIAADAGAPTITAEQSVRDAINAMLVSGFTEVNVSSRGGAPIGSLSFEAICSLCASARRA